MVGCFVWLGCRCRATKAPRDWSAVPVKQTARQSSCPYIREVNADEEQPDRLFARERAMVQAIVLFHQCRDWDWNASQTERACAFSPTEP